MIRNSKVSLKRFVQFLTISSLIFSLFLGFVSIHAQSSDRGLIISPIVNDLDVEKAQNYSYNLDLYNDTSNYKYNINITKQTFVPSQNDGVPELAEFSTENDYSNWLNFDQTRFIIDSGQKQTVQVNLNIPNDAKAGGYYFALIFSDNPDSQDSLGAAVKIKQRIAALLFVNVKGQVEKSVKFTNIETNQKIYDPFLDTVLLKYTIKVEGGTYLKPSGNIFLNDGAKTGIDLFSLNPAEKIILPNSSRTFALNSDPSIQIPFLQNILGVTKVEAQETITKNDKSDKNSNENQVNLLKLLFGNQKITARVIYVDSDGKIAQQNTETNIFYFPWKSLLIVSFVLFVVGFVIYRFRLPRKTS